MQNRFHYISLARIVAAIFVITIHTVETYGKVSTERYWIEANIIIGIVECAVPIFFMIIGATLLEYKDRYSTKEYFKKRLYKVVLPLAVWYIISIIYGFIMDTQSMSFPYWFFFEMLGIYLCIPVFASIEKKHKDKVITYIVVFSFIMNYLIPLVFDIIDFNTAIDIPFDVGTGFLLYVLVGYLIHKNDISFKWRIAIYVFAVIGFILKAGGTYFLSLKNGALDGTFGHYENVPCFLITVGVFVLIKQIGSKLENKKIINVINFLGGCTMASYVLHQYVSHYLIRPHVTNIYSLPYNLCTPVLNFMICVGITCVLRKIPIIKRLVP